MNTLLACALLTILIGERIPALRFERCPILRRYWPTDLVYLLTSGIALGLLLRESAARLAQALGPLPLQGLLPALLAIPLATVLYDLSSYMTHLLLHRSEPLWRFHKVHHSSRTLDWLATFRGHLVEHALRHLTSPVALLLLGFRPSVVAAAGAIYAAWAALGHSNLRIDLRFLEPLFITPRLHRLHHVPSTSNANLGTIFSVWDRMRGTLVSDAASAPLGVPGEVETYPQSWLPQLVEPLRPRASSSPALRAGVR